MPFGIRCRLIQQLKKESSVQSWCRLQWQTYDSFDLHNIQTSFLIQPIFFQIVQWASIMLLLQLAKYSKQNLFLAWWWLLPIFPKTLNISLYNGTLRPMETLPLSSYYIYPGKIFQFYRLACLVDGTSEHRSHHRLCWFLGVGRERYYFGQSQSQIQANQTKNEMK